MAEPGPEVMARYALAVNTRDVAGFVALFTLDGEWNRPGGHSMRGHDEIRAYIDYALADPAQRTLRHVNGAEIDALDGLNEYFDRVRVIYAAASFHASGEALNTKVADALAARGCWVKKSDEFVLAVTPRFRGHFKVK